MKEARFHRHVPPQRRVNRLRLLHAAADEQDFLRREFLQ
jgi:hypothetical protein